ncbi:MAG: hypothetical protein EBY49_09440 [Actinobacteria bacterium]|nr:hypothetical protein [Actinomycetota bacterium]
MSSSVESSSAAVSSSVESSVVVPAPSSVPSSSSVLTHALAISANEKSATSSLSNAEWRSFVMGPPPWVQLFFVSQARI